MEDNELGVLTRDGSVSQREAMELDEEVYSRELRNLTQSGHNGLNGYIQ